MSYFGEAMGHCGTCNTSFPISAKHYCFAQGIAGVEITVSDSSAPRLAPEMLESCEECDRLRSLASSLAGALRECLREVDACIRVLAREGIIHSEDVGKDKRDEFRARLAEYEAATAEPEAK